MHTLHKETALDNPACELRIGHSSWDSNAISLKYTWFNEKDGKAARGGEFPIEAAQQLCDFAIRMGYAVSPAAATPPAPPSQPPQPPSPFDALLAKLDAIADGLHRVAVTIGDAIMDATPRTIA
jgi:HD superfamily phosphodiesterase